MYCPLTADTPVHVYNAIEVLMGAETGRGPYRFLDEAADYLPFLADWGEAPDETLAPLDKAIERAVYHAYTVEEEAEARRWKAAGQALKAVRDCQELYRVRLHVEGLQPIPGYVIQGHVTLGEPRLHVYSGDRETHLFDLPPTSSQETVQAAITAWRAGYKLGARHAMQAIRGTVDYVEGAV